MIDFIISSQTPDGLIDTLTVRSDSYRDAVARYRKATGNRYGLLSTVWARGSRKANRKVFAELSGKGKAA